MTGSWMPLSTCSSILLRQRASYPPPPTTTHTHTHPFNPQNKVATPSSSEVHTFSDDKFAPPPMPDGFKSH